MTNEKLESALKSIGKRSFVEDYEVYSNQNITSTKKIEILTEKYSKNGSTIRVSFAEEIFKNHMQKEALNIIIGSPRISNEVKTLARGIFNNLI
jgi:hypothetical protein